jgi:hypothetical protein
MFDQLESLFTSSPLPSRLGLQIYAVLDGSTGPNLLLTDQRHYVEAFFAGLNSAEVAVGQFALVEDFSVAVEDNKPLLQIRSLSPGQMLDVSAKVPMLQIAAKNNSQNNYIPASALCPFLEDWVLRAKIIKKSDVKEFSSQKTQRTDKFMSATMVDNFSCRIFASFMGNR